MLCSYRGSHSAPDKASAPSFAHRSGALTLWGLHTGMLGKNVAISLNSGKVKSQHGLYPTDGSVDCQNEQVKRFRYAACLTCCLEDDGRRVCGDARLSPMREDHRRKWEYVWLPFRGPVQRRFHDLTATINVIFEVRHLPEACAVRADYSTYKFPRCRCHFLTSKSR
jgi:hypothetical protein